MFLECCISKYSHGVIYTGTYYIHDFVVCPEFHKQIAGDQVRAISTEIGMANSF